MTPIITAGSKELGQAIKARRLQLGMSIEKASNQAGIGSKTWYRYEKGENIRSDKMPEIMKVLRWVAYPKFIFDSNTESLVLSHEDFDFVAKESFRAWPKSLENEYGTNTAHLFATGYNLVYDAVSNAFNKLRALPHGTSVEEIEWSLTPLLPKAFLSRYDIDFIYALKSALNNIGCQANRGEEIVAQTVLEEIALHMIILEGESFEEEGLVEYTDIEEECPEGLFSEIADKNDVWHMLYQSGDYIPPQDHKYHFDQWTKPQFLNTK